VLEDSWSALAGSSSRVPLAPTGGRHTSLLSRSSRRARPTGTSMDMKRSTCYTLTSIRLGHFGRSSTQVSLTAFNGSKACLLVTLRADP
jgi:hypothetical protein